MPGTDTPRNDPQLLTIRQLSRLYGVGEHTLRRAAKRGEFPLYAAGTAWPRVRRSEFEAWLRSTRLPTPSELGDG